MISNPLDPFHQPPNIPQSLSSKNKVKRNNPLDSTFFHHLLLNFFGLRKSCPIPFLLKLTPIKALF